MASASRLRRTGAVAAQQRPMLFDAKSIFAGGGRYRGSAEVREDQSGAVELRARQVPTEYRRNAREKDQQYGPAGSTLIQDRVASFGACRAVVFGNYGEASRDVHTLIHVAAQRLATKHWRLLGPAARRAARALKRVPLRRKVQPHRAALLLHCSSPPHASRRADKRARGAPVSPRTVARCPSAPRARPSHPGCAARSGPCAPSLPPAARAELAPAPAPARAATAPRLS